MSLEEIERRLAELERERRELIKQAEQLKERQAKLSLPFLESQPTVFKIPTTPQEKVALFGSIFQGRSDVFAERWESRDKKLSGYSPVCINKWSSDCNLPRGAKCSQCKNRQYMPVSPQVLKKHLQGKMTIGLYPLINSNRCRFCAMDFDEKNWATDGITVLKVARRLGIPIYPEISRSGNGVHLWIFFSEDVSAALARTLCDRILAKAMEEPENAVQLNSFDRIIPCQDSVLSSALGNLIALPLQWKPRSKGHSVFCTDDLKPIDDQWAFLANIVRWTEYELKECLETHRVNARIDSEVRDYSLLPWESEDEDVIPLIDRPQGKIKIDVANRVYLEKRCLSSRLQQRLIRMVSYQNPVFFARQAAHMPVYKVARFLSLAETLNGYLSLPRGILSKLLRLFERNSIDCEVIDHRPMNVIDGCSFLGTLRPAQKKIFSEINQYENAILVASTGFGKTVLTAALIAKRSVRTLILMHNKELLLQWKEALGVWLKCESGSIGIWHGGKHLKTNYIDIALFQSIASLSEREQKEFLRPYSFVVVDECHHLASGRFSQIFNLTQSRYVLGLTATLIRKDGKERIIKYLCGDSVVQFKNPRPFLVQLFPISFKATPKQKEDESFSKYIGRVAKDEKRNEWIVEKIASEYALGRKILVLTDRVNQQMALASMLTPRVENLYVLRPTVKKVEREELKLSLQKLDDSQARVLVATGKLVGEGFDYPVLDTLFLALPFAWRGTLTQYVGRIVREYSGKNVVRIYDVLDEDCPVLMSMWNRRRKGYATNGIAPMAEDDLLKNV